MKFTIRHSVFETNSSSMHSFSYAKTFEPNKLNIPKELYIKTAIFGWYTPVEFENNSVEEKASYLYTAAIQFDKVEELKEALFNIADDFNFTISFEDINMSEFYGIDHSSTDEASELLCNVLNNDAVLLNFLFRDDTDIVISNDNECFIEGALKGEKRTVIGYGMTQLEKEENEKERRISNEIYY